MFSIFYDPTNDLKNWLRIKDKYPADFTITKFYPFDKSIVFTQNNFKKIVKTISLEQIKKYNDISRNLELEWKKVESKIIEKISNYLRIKPYKMNFKVSLTTAYYMPYSFTDKWFMVPIHKDIKAQLECIVHELFHLYHLEKDPDIPQEELEKEVNKFTKFL